MPRWLWKTAAALFAILTASCGYGVGGSAGTPSERCSLPPDIGKTGAAPHTETGIGADARNYHPLDRGGDR